MTPRPLRVGVVGPLLGGHPGWVTGQGERLAERLDHDGLTVRTTSDSIGRARRAAATWRAIRSWADDVDVVIVLVFSGPAFAMADLATRTARSVGLPVILWLHGGNLPPFARRHPRWSGAVWRRADVVVAPSPYLAGLNASAPTGVPRAVVIPNVLAEAITPITSRVSPGHRVLWMRTFHPLYRPTMAVDVLAGLLSAWPDATLTMAGQDKGELVATERHARALGVEGHLRFAGFLDPSAKRQAFADHDVFLNTSSTDNAPVSLLEAAAHGLPIVSTAVGGVPDLFPPHDAALLADDVQGLIGAVTALFDDPAAAERLAGSAHRRAEASTWQHVGPHWHALLAEVARG